MLSYSADLSLAGRQVWPAGSFFPESPLAPASLLLCSIDVLGFMKPSVNSR